MRAFEEAVRVLPGTEQRKMFGYPAVFVNGNMFAGPLRDMMVLRLDTANRERVLERPGARPFIAMKGRVMKQWAVVPPAMLKTRSELKGWLGQALEYGRSLPPKVTKRRPSSK